MFSEDESEVLIGSKVQIKIHENLQNGQCNEISSDPSYSVLTMQNKNTTRSSQVSINFYDNNILAK